MRPVRPAAQRTVDSAHEPKRASASDRAPAARARSAHRYQYARSQGQNRKLGRAHPRASLLRHGAPNTTTSGAGMSERREMGRGGGRGARGWTQNDFPGPGQTKPPFPTTRAAPLPAAHAWFADSRLCPEVLRFHSLTFYGRGRRASAHPRLRRVGWQRGPPSQPGFIILGRMNRLRDHAPPARAKKKHFRQSYKLGPRQSAGREPPG